MSASAVLELIGVRKRYGPQVAVDGLDLTLRPQEFMTFLGPSGSGKTTTLMMVAGLQQPDAGRIVLNGQPVDRLPPYRRDIGMVFQHYALFPHMTVWRNVAFPLELRRVSRAQIEQQVTETLLLVGLPGYGDRLPRELSGGQQQRVALARAIIYGPALLLMDEPLGALDRKLREQLQMEIVRIHRERRMSVLYVTHDQEEALTMSDRIAVFNEGRIEQVGTPDELYERPANRFVAGFIGQSNFLPGVVVGVGVGSCSVGLDGRVVQASAPQPLASGADVVVAIRPERLALARTGDGLRARLEAVVYLGNAKRFVLRRPDGLQCTALQQVGTMGDDSFSIGDELTLSFRPEHAVAFGR